MRVQRGSRNLRSWASWVGAAAIALVLSLSLQAEAQAQERFASSQGDAAPVTYASDVAEIVNENCVVCHREGGIAPMSLEEPEQVERYAPLIKLRVENEEMPPYAYDRTVGVQDLVDDWRLSEEEITTVVNWVDQGAEMGDLSEAPPAPDLPDPDEWSFAERYGPPDVVVPSTPIDVPAGGNDMWHRPFVPSGIESDRCIKAVQVKPRGDAKTVVHHANSTFRIQQDDGSFERAGRVTEYAMGKVGEIMPEGVCRTAPEDSHVRWDIHLYPGGIGATAPDDMIEDNVVELGIWFHEEDYEAEYDQNLSLYGVDEGELLIEPNGWTFQQDFHTFDHPVRIDSWQPHGHLVMRHASLEVRYPDGRIETISRVSDWSATWHHSHIYESDVAPLLPAGAVLIVKQWYDNTAENSNNPDSDQWVYGGSRTADEMDHAWIAVTHLDEEGYERLLAEREEDEDDEDRVAGADD